VSIKNRECHTTSGDIINHVYPEGYEAPDGMWARMCERIVIYICVTILIGMIIAGVL
jgi:hypothetical protein